MGELNMGELNMGEIEHVADRSLISLQLRP
jgi:hypothetical protein